MPTFTHAGHRLAYTEHGTGPRACVLLHGLLLSQRMHEPLAHELAGRGNRVITLDLLGHGRSDRPTDMWRYSMPQFAEQVLALLDALEVDEAVVGGTSLGANVALETACAAPDRVRGMVVEMPVLDNALVACAIAFSPLLVSLTLGEPVMRLASRAARAVPDGLLGWLGDVALDTVRQEPRPSGAVLQGLFFGRVAPHRVQRRQIESPALVIGHRRDPVHPFSDAGMLVEELPGARLIEASTMLELRLAPERLTDEIADFLDECWRPRRATRGRRRADERAS
jgi:pimeloyl-ACP methyl ester carboxylesterase